MKKFKEFKMINESSIYSLQDIAEFISRVGYDEEYLIEILEKTYQEKGDQGVVNFVNNFAKGDMAIDTIGRRKYILKF